MLEFAARLSATVQCHIWDGSGALEFVVAKYAAANSRAQRQVVQCA